MQKNSTAQPVLWLSLQPLSTEAIVPMKTENTVKKPNFVIWVNQLCKISVRGCYTSTSAFTFLSTDRD